MNRKTLAILIVVALGACDAVQAPGAARTAVPAPAAKLPPGETVLGANGFELTLPAGVTRASLGEGEVETLAVQVLLDRSRHSPGVIDGLNGSNLERAIGSFRRDAGLPEGEAIDAELLRALLASEGGNIFRTYTITAEDLRGPFVEVPDDMAAMADLDFVGYQSPGEALAERFHMDDEFLAALNPNADFNRAGTRIAIVAPQTRGLGAKVTRIEVRTSANAVVVMAADGTVLATYPATIGSADFPSPSGTMQVAAVAPRANYTFDNSRNEWGPQDSFVIAPGPNNPVGGVWIGLTKDGYGIHGSPDPHLVGKTSSHGCVRLTNWDARELAAAVADGVEVVFV